MSTTDNSSKCSGGDYLTKQVLLNGQFVTLYSLNGHTWLSSPEDIPALMERLENERIALFNGEKAPEAEDSKNKESEKTAEKSNAAPSTKYRMKGPKPRPILEQNGKTFKGPAVEPVSASNTVMKFSSDLPESEAHRKAKTNTGGKALSKSKVKKLLSEVTDLPKKAKKLPAKKNDSKSEVKKAQKKVSSKDVRKKDSSGKRTPLKKPTKKTTSAKAKTSNEKGKNSSNKTVKKNAVKAQTKVSKTPVSKKTKTGAPSRVKVAKKSSQKKPSEPSKRSTRKSTSKKSKVR